MGDAVNKRPSRNTGSGSQPLSTSKTGNPNSNTGNPSTQSKGRKTNTAATTTTTMTGGSKKNNSSRHRLGSCGSLVFLAMAMLTLLQNTSKAVHFGYLVDCPRVSKIQIGLEMVVVITIFILKILSVTYYKNTLKVACLLMMVFYIFLSCVAFAFLYTDDYESSTSIQVGSIFGSCMDIVAYLLYLRIKQVKTE